ncbi:transposase [Bradyrhizobium manausense]|uniref:Transposase n=1 Tax=Bradyrhizobium manausense TaxID=989370 RepID=A0A0R3E297_9BRAD|nr:integrase core domain-containing protein [Bradyrhizobium manausense]KRQ16267.1 transposase [Bradyrhizobium manausense]
MSDTPIDEDFTWLHVGIRLALAYFQILVLRKPCGTDVVEVLERACKEVGFPATIRVDQGSEFVSRDVDLWAYQRGVTLDFSRPGKPTDNAFIEAFNGRFRAECLNAHWFLSLADARQKVETWRRYYNRASEHPSVYVVEEKKLC